MKKTVIFSVLAIAVVSVGLIIGCGTTITTQPSGAIIRLYYTFPTDPTKKDKDYSSQNFGSAYSSDGINFTKDAGIRLGPLAKLTDPDVIKASSNNWIMFYSKAVSQITTEASRLYRATCSTPNGPFTDDGSFAGNYGNISSSINIGGIIHVYGVSSEGIVISTYEAGTNKLHYVEVAISGGVADPSVIQLTSNSFKMYYKSSGDIYCASSTDGKIWGSGTPIVSKAEVPGAVYVNNKIYLYYISSDPSDPNIGKILVRISSDNGTTFSSAQVVTGLHDAACDPDPVVYE
ncbi:MAG: hypothetical protein ACPL1K_03400 [Candidatus Kryptoniota bacterium]